MGRKAVKEKIDELRKTSTNGYTGKKMKKPTKAVKDEIDQNCYTGKKMKKPKLKNSTSGSTSKKTNCCTRKKMKKPTKASTRPKRKKLNIR